MQHHHHDSTINSQLCIQVISTLTSCLWGKIRLRKVVRKTVTKILILKHSSAPSPTSALQCHLPFPSHLWEMLIEESCQWTSPQSHQHHSGLDHWATDMGIM